LATVRDLAAAGDAGRGAATLAGWGGRMADELDCADATLIALAAVKKPSDVEKQTTTERHRCPVVSGMNPFPV
jgi:hypothetical protein